MADKLERTLTSLLYLLLTAQIYFQILNAIDKKNPSPNSNRLDLIFDIGNVSATDISKEG